MSKIESLVKNVDLSRCPHVWWYGERVEPGWKGVAVVLTEVDDDANDTYTEIDEKEMAEVRRAFRPFQVKFFPSLMLTFKEWLSGVPKRRHPITGVTYRNFNPRC